MEKEKSKNVYVKPMFTVINMNVESSILTTSSSTEEYKEVEW